VGVSSSSSGFVAGETLGEYRVVELLGEGAMGSVFRATRVADGADVAIKVIREELAHDPQYRKRFIHEARAARGAQHRNLVSIIDVGEVDGRQYLAMPYVPGGTLEDRISEHGPLTTPQAVRLVTEIAGALSAVHEAGLVHRDIKPSNIILREDDGSAALSDFGLAKGAGYSQLTRPGQIVGTLDYLAPERILGQEATPASDVYALGCVAFECFSGQPPFAGRGLLQVGMAHLEEAPPDPFEGRDDALCRAVLMPLAKEPAERPLPPSVYADLLRQACPPVVAG
jgi:serine/threonine protein kinase